MHQYIFPHIKAKFDLFFSSPFVLQFLKDIMEAITYDHTSPIPPAKLFNIILDADKLIPRILPQAVKSVDILQGDGHQTGTIYAAQFGQGTHPYH